MRHKLERVNVIVMSTEMKNTPFLNVTKKLMTEKGLCGWQFNVYTVYTHTCIVYTGKHRHTGTNTCMYTHTYTHSHTSLPTKLFYAICYKSTSTLPVYHSPRQTFNH